MRLILTICALARFLPNTQKKSLRESPVTPSMCLSYGREKKQPSFEFLLLSRMFIHHSDCPPTFPVSRDLNASANQLGVDDRTIRRWRFFHTSTHRPSERYPRRTQKTPRGNQIRLERLDFQDIK